MIEPVYITDFIGSIVDTAKVAPQTETSNLLQTIQANEAAAIGTASPITTINYQFGHYNELIETLAEYDRSETKQPDKYPLVWLRTDFRERRGQEAGVYAEVFLNLVICHFTRQEIKSTERMTRVFKPVLYPIYYELLHQLGLSPLTMVFDDGFVSHDKYDRYYWGTSQVGKTTDFVDAIEIDNLALKIYYKNCYNT